MQSKSPYLTSELVEAIMLRRDLERDAAIEWINSASAYDCLDEYLCWHGIMGWTGSIMRIVEYKAKA